MTRQNRLHLADQVITILFAFVKNFSWVALTIALGLSLEASAKFRSKAECEARLADTDASLVQIWRSIRDHVLESFEQMGDDRVRNGYYYLNVGLRSLDDCLNFGRDLRSWLNRDTIGLRVKFLSPKDVDALIARTAVKIASKIVSPPLKKFFRDAKYPDPLSSSPASDPWDYDEFRRSAPLLYGDLVRGVYAMAVKSERSSIAYASIINRVLDREKGRLELEIRRQWQHDWRDHAFPDWMGDRGNVFAMFYLAHMLDKTKGRFVDIGSGMGDPSLILAPLFPEMEFIGYELVDLKVNAANAMAKDLGLENVAFYQQNLGDQDFTLPAADYYYFFNPVTESVSQKVADDIAQAVKSQRTVTAFFRMGIYHVELVHRALTMEGFKCQLSQNEEIQRLSCKRP